MMGIHVNRTKIIVFTISGLMAACSGIILCGRLSAGQPTACEGGEMTIMAAVVLGRHVRARRHRKDPRRVSGLPVRDVYHQPDQLKRAYQRVLEDIITGVVLLIAVLVQVYSDKQKEKVNIPGRTGSKIVKEYIITIEGHYQHPVYPLGQRAEADRQERRAVGVRNTSIDGNNGKLTGGAEVHRAAFGAQRRRL